jgi:hypothetical protein
MLAVLGGTVKDQAMAHLLVLPWTNSVVRTTATPARSTDTAQQQQQQVTGPA